jgi:hypothetical protein
MASEIRVNKIENRSGLGTVTFADTGVDLAGIVTATTFSGSGASLTSLPAAQLSGTLPAISAANLTNVPAANITGTLPAISAANLTNIPAANVTGTLPAISAANLTSIPAANIVGVATGGFKKSGESSLQVLEQFWLLTDGRSVSTSNGTVTTTNVTAAQTLTDSFVAATGSSLTYQPPAGTTELIYEYQFMVDETNAEDRYLFVYHVDIDGTAILESRGSEYVSANHQNISHHVKYAFRIGSGSDNATTGDRASWSSNKTISLKIARWSSSYSVDLHRLRYYNPGGSADNIIRRPYVGITAIGQLT